MSEQNSILIKEDIDIKEDILTYMVNDDCNETCHTEK